MIRFVILLFFLFFLLTELVLAPRFFILLFVLLLVLFIGYLCEFLEVTADCLVVALSVKYLLDVGLFCLNFH